MDKNYRQSKQKQNLRAARSAAPKADWSKPGDLNTNEFTQNNL